MNVNEKRYIDGFVAAVPAQNKDKFLEIARQAATIYREHGALQVVETWGDDIPDGEITSFRRAVNAKDGEVIVFSWIMWPSKEARNKGNEAVMNDPRMEMPQEEPPFDAKRMIYGGFQLLLDE